MTCDEIAAACSPRRAQILLFELRRQVRERANCAGKLAHPQVFRSVGKAFDVALHLGIPIRDLEAERDRLGMEVHRACVRSWASVFELPGAPLQ